MSISDLTADLKVKASRLFFTIINIQHGKFAVIIHVYGMTSILGEDNGCSPTIMWIDV